MRYTPKMRRLVASYFTGSRRGSAGLGMALGLACACAPTGCDIAVNPGVAQARFTPRIEPVHVA
ncbi:hypothetical protein [Pseudomonas profundi]|uniref:hypothetical protein n=1 Tax=Pseudomonas profundi TaxID=1981513 RepID=UPI00123A415C|nr:hypothetical protein [Pseudomonas profundi]